ncbi:hypothetical protein [Mycolicibacterium insubricum]|uniref:hypothetical protein n=1 Tax=Mycolicibacterium insubricum TaxID=444597 RepID=UPI0021F2F1B1|nr:hypothetical protein [Mycolicibacterium insubricum]MCV7081500.1 hypothetical protein [Mycolicibacterium insubricum]
MSRIKSLFAGSAVLAGASLALLAGGIAKADPEPAPAPAVPDLSVIQQFLDPSKAPALLQP